MQLKLSQAFWKQSSCQYRKLVPDAEGDAGAMEDDASTMVSSESSMEEEATSTTVLAAPGAKLTLAVGFCWDIARSELGFLAHFYMTAKTHDPFLVELSGAASWVFLLAGPYLGAWSDRWDRKLIMTGNLAAMSFLNVFVALALFSGEGPWWLMFILMPCVSFSSVVDQTVYGPFSSDLLAASQQEHMISTMSALRTFGYNIGRVIGIQLVGVIVDYVGFGASFLFVAAQVFAGTVLALWLPRFAKVGSGSSGGSAAASHAPLWSRSFVSVLGVTAIANFFYFSHYPLIPVLGTGLGASPSGTGLLSSATFCGALFVSAVVVKWNPSATGVLYCVGIALADVALAGATMPSLAASFGSLVCAGGSASLFGTVQVAMVMGMAPADLRGSALGMLSLAIGAGPFGMAVLGKLAERFGADTALSRFALIGVICQVLWLLVLPDALHVRRPS